MKLWFYTYLTCLAVFCSAQIWQNAYDSAVKYQEKLQFELSIDWALKALHFYEQQVKYKDTTYSNILSRLVENFYYIGDYDQAEMYAKQDSAWAASYHNSVRYVTSIYNLSHVYVAKFRYLEAQKLLELARTILLGNDGEKNSNYTDICELLSEVYSAQGLYSKAEELAKESLEIKLYLYGVNNPNYAYALENIGKIFKLQGKYAEAEIYLKESLLILEKVLGKTSQEYAFLCKHLADLYQEQGRYEESQTLFQQARQILSMTIGKETVPYAVVCNDLGNLYYNKELYTQAESLYVEAMDIQHKILGEHPEYATTCANLANVYAAKKQYSKAEDMLKKAMKITVAVTGKENFLYPVLCHNLARIYQYQKRYIEAENLFQESVDIIRSTFGNTYPYYTKIRHSLAKMYHEKQEYDKAELIYEEVTQIKSREIQENFKNLSEVEKEQYIQANIADYINDFQCFVLKTYLQRPAVTAHGYNLILQTKGLILQSMEKIKQRILQSNDNELKDLYLLWKNAREMYVKSQSLTLQERKKRNIQLDSLYQKANEIEKKLAMKTQSLSINFVDNKPLQWKDIQSKLNHHQAAIEVSRVTENQRTYYLVFVVKKKSTYPELIVLKNGDSLEKEYYINYKRSIIHKFYDEYSYLAYWKPILKALNGIKTVYFSADGVYHKINLCTLQNPVTKKHVLDEIQIIYVTKTSDIVQEKISSSQHQKSYFIGNPKYLVGLYTKGNEKPEIYWEFDNLAPLPGAEKEVTELSLYIPNSYVSTSYEATEEQVKSIKNPRVLHIATHGYFKKGQYQSSTQAMLNAGLLFAGVADYDKMEIRPINKEDGKLTAFEVMNMELDSTELVVLSACETGLGQASREGVYGLQRAFKVAGAKMIIMSLWKVNDLATQVLMKNFYQNWSVKGMSKRKAFEMAQKQTREHYREPYYWGAFIMIE
ncbi:MAG: CHAT domain-containing protein [Bacteroidia bacterium]|nr:CHAT domain-containing protein [Bacteroidia bacterium]